MVFLFYGPDIWDCFNPAFFLSQIKTIFLDFFKKIGEKHCETKRLRIFATNWLHKKYIYK